MSREAKPRPGAKPGYDRSVFINCPFDPDYQTMFDALVFAVYACGFRPRCALEAANSGAVRLEKIVGIIRECRFGIHDICRTEVNAESLPRFNMPFELGLFMGAQRVGTGRQRTKTCLILDREPYRYQRFLSDIAGQDLRPHQGDPRRAAAEVRNWLATETRREGGDPLPGAAEVNRRFAEFQAAAPLIAERYRLDGEQNRTFADYTALISIWLRETLPARRLP